MRSLVGLFVCMLLISCQKSTSTTQNEDDLLAENIELDYAKTFSITDHGDFYIVKIIEPWPGADQSYTYLFYKKDAAIPTDLNVDHKLQIPVRNLIVSSTTHIPPIEALDKLNTIIGFPNTSYISSPKARNLIDSGSIKDVGNTQSLNTELVLSLNPECLVTFAVKGENKAISTIEKANIPILYNADWVEQHPLGKTEWIKFYGVLFDKLDEANRIFNGIKSSYEDAKRLASNSSKRPSVISGALWKDQWYLPGGNSWQARLIKDANADYLYAETQETGSLSLSLESVLVNAKDAELWISPSQFTSYTQMKTENSFYEKFKAFQTQNVFTFAKNKGDTGGVIYYEMASHRPDWVLKDLIHIFHPELLTDYNTHFFKPLDP